MARATGYLRGSRVGLSLTVGLTLLAMGAAAGAQTATVTPTKGQSPQQVEADKQQCYGAAVQSSGYDPAASQAAQPAAGGRARGAATGAAAWSGIRRAAARV